MLLNHHVKLALGLLGLIFDCLLLLLVLLLLLHTDLVMVFNLDKADGDVGRGLNAIDFGRSSFWKNRE